MDKQTENALTAEQTLQVSIVENAPPPTTSCTLGLTPEFRLVKITKRGGSLSKRISRDGDGQLKVDASACGMSRGNALTFVVKDGMAGLARLYADLRENEAVVFSNTDLGTDPREVCTESVFKDEKKQNPNVITRSKRFLPSASAPGLQLFEVDDHGLPPGKRAPDANQLVEMLAELLPELDVPGAARLMTHSTSSHIYDTNTGQQIKGDGGKHIAMLLSDQSASGRLKTLLDVRQWANGHGHIYISRDGRQIERTVLDLSVFAPERLVFEAGAVLGDGLEQRRPAPTAVEGHPLDMSRLPSPTLTERELANKAKAIAKQASSADAEEIRSKYLREEAEKLIAQRGIDQDEADRIVALRAEIASLDDGDTLTFTDKRADDTQTVGYVLDRIEQYIGRAMCDPLEPDYGPSKAMILRGPGGQPYIQSFAHGGRRLTFCRIQGQEGAVDQALFPFTDLANAHRIANAFGDSLIATATGWNVFTGSHWQRADHLAEQKALNLSRLILQDPQYLALRSRIEQNDFADKDKWWKAQKLAGKWTTFAAQSENQAKITAALNMAKTLLWRDVWEMNTDPWLFNVMNGTIDLRTGVLRPHDREDFITMLAPIDFTPDATCPTFEKTVLEIFDGDDQLCRFLQRFLGYSLTGLTIEQQMLIAWGDGANGKTTILGTIQKILGRDYFGAAPPRLLEATRWDRHPTEIADLYGKRVVIASETEEGAQLREAFLKLATGSDWLKGRFMHKDFFEFEPTHKFILQTNHKPEVKGTDYAIWRRLLLLPFEIIFGDKTAIDAGDASRLKDTSLSTKLSSEREGILAWMVRGCIEWQRQGLAPPTKVRGATDSYREEQDRMGQFVADHCEYKEGHQVEQAVIYKQYQYWCSNNGYHPMGSNKFRKQLLKLARGKVTVSRISVGTRKNIASYVGIMVPDDKFITTH